MPSAPYAVFGVAASMNSISFCRVSTCSGYPAAAPASTGESLAKTATSGEVAGSVKRLLVLSVSVAASACQAPTPGWWSRAVAPPPRQAVARAPTPVRERAPHLPPGALVPKSRQLHAGPDAYRYPGGWITLGWSVEGRPIRCLVMGEGAELIVVVGAIHGDEPAGAPLVRLLARQLEARPDLLEGRQVALIPVANPDGLVHGDRLNARGRDINRNWPSDNWIPGKRRGPRPLSEPETRALYHFIGDRRPTRIVAIHQPLSGINWDGPAGRLARKVSRVSGLPRTEMRERRGSIGSFAGRDRDVPVLTLELPQSAADMRIDELWRRYGDALLWSITWPDSPVEDLSAAVVSPP